MPHAGKMVAFASLWLGIVAGTVPVELLLPAETARIELFLDGRPAGVRTRAPWKLTLDLGEEIAPHELVAVATDAAGNELGRARQWLNLPRPPAELEVVLQATPEAGGVARVAWRATAGAAPLAVRAMLDGRPLPAADPAALPLPPFDAASPHLLRVEAEFPGGLTASRELAFGGALAEETRAELTAVPVLLEGRRLAGEIPVLGRGGETLPPLAVEEGEEDLVIVLDPSASEELQKLPRQVSGMSLPIRGLRSLANKVDRRFLAPLPAASRLRILWPVARRTARRDLRWQVFPHTEELSPREGGILWHLLKIGVPRQGTPALADAVAVAGVAAAHGARRRAVLLILGPEPIEVSRHTPDVVRRYLERLRVPLHVWSLGETSASAADWGEVERVRNLAALERAAKRLAETLDRQRIVWVAGAHLPQDLALAPEAVGVLPVGTLGRPEPVAEESEAEETLVAEALADGGPAAPGSGASAAAVSPALPAVLPAALASFAAGPFDLRTDLEDRTAVAGLGRVAVALPGVWSARFGLPLGESLAGTLLVFRREEDFRAFAHAEGEDPDRFVRGSSRGQRVALAAGGKPPGEVTALFVHELAHLLARAAFDRELPAWLEEGLAEELALARVDRTGVVQPGTLRGGVRARAVDASSSRPAFFSRYEISADGAYGALAALLQARRLGAAPTLPQLLVMPPEVFGRPEGRRERYTASAFFVRFLLDGRERRARAPFHAFLAAVAKGGPADAAALSATLGEPLAHLDRDFAAWLRLQATANR